MDETHPNFTNKKDLRDFLSGLQLSIVRSLAHPLNCYTERSSAQMEITLDLIKSTPCAHAYVVYPFSRYHSTALRNASRAGVYS